jgi:hypothetical protein
MDRLPPLWRRATKRTAPLINSFTVPVKLTDVIPGELRGMRDRMHRVLVTPSLPLGDTIAVSALAAHRVRSGYGAPAHVGCHASRSMRLRICPSRSRVKGSAPRSAPAPGAAMPVTRRPGERLSSPDTRPGSRTRPEERLIVAQNENRGEEPLRLRFYNL